MTDQRILSGPTSQYHCIKGPLSVEEHKVSEDFKEKEKIMLDIYKEIGMTTLWEANIPRPNGSSLVNFKVRDKKRASTAQEFYLPIKDRKNLCVMTNTLALKILINYRNQAIGVRVQTRLGKFNVYADIEVILSAGVFNSPQLLMLSGIGPKNHLKEMGIKVVVESPGVGRNLQDHLLVPIGISGKVDETDEQQLTLEALRTLPLPLIGGTFSLDDGTPDLQHLTAHFGKSSAVFFMTLHYTFGWNLDISKSFILNYPDREMFYVMAFLARPKSRGRVMLRSKNPQDPPRIYTGFLKEEEDLLKMTKAVKKLYSIKDSTYVQNAGGGFSRPPLPACDNLQFESDDYWKCYVKVLANTPFHAVGTCSVGSVVDESLQVNGVKKLRVVDDSVMEFIPCAKTGAVTIMIAEKAADIIKRKYGMAAGYRKFPCK